MNGNLSPRYLRWWPVVAAVLIVFLVYGIAGVVMNNDATSPHRTAPQNHPEGSIEEAIDDLLARGQTELPPEYPSSRNGQYSQGKGHQRDKTYLLAPGETGYVAQENAAVRDYHYFLGGIHPHEDRFWRTYTEPTPGMSLDIDGEFSCTLGFIGHYEDSGAGESQRDRDRREPESAAITAGHCMESDEDGIIEWSPGEDGYPIAPLGTWDASQALDAYSVEVGDLSDRYAGAGSHPAPEPLGRRLDTDWATMSIHERQTVDSRIDGRYDVVTTADPTDLRPGMMVCKMGFRTGETCGPVLSWNETMVRVNLYSLTGDSGSPAYIKLEGNKVAALGLLSSSPMDTNDVTNDYVTDFALVAPAMRQTGFRLGPA